MNLSRITQISWAGMLYLFLATPYCLAQLPSAVWADSFQGSTSTAALDMAVDAQGSIYTTGFFNGSVDFDPGPGITAFTAGFYLDCYMMKLLPNGELGWVAHLGGGGGDTEARAIGLDQSGNLLIAGRGALGSDLDPGPGVHAMSGDGGFVAKYSPAGNFNWAMPVGGNTVLVRDMVVDLSGNSIVVGSFMGTVDFDPSGAVYNLTAVAPNVFLLKLSPSGAFLWAKQFQADTEVDAYTMTADNNENLYVGGLFTGICDFDPSSSEVLLTALGGGDAYVVKLNSNGNFLWARAMGGNASNFAEAVRSISTNGAVVVSTGSYMGSGDFDPGISVSTLTSAGGADCFISVLDASGSYLAAKSIGSFGNDSPESIAFGDDGAIYFHGQFLFDVDVDLGSGQQIMPGGNYVCKWTQDLEYEWAFGSTSFIIQRAVIDAEARMYGVGGCTAGADVDPSSGILQVNHSGMLQMKLQPVSTGQIVSAVKEQIELMVWNPSGIPGNLRMIYPVLSDEGSLSILDATGRLVCEYAVPQGSSTFDFSMTVSQGLYVIRLLHNGHVGSVPVFVE